MQERADFAAASVGYGKVTRPFLLSRGAFDVRGGLAPSRLNGRMATAIVVVLVTGLVSMLVLLLTFRLTRANELHKWLREK
jgi:hypothetical protein